MTKEEAIKIINCYDIGFYDLSGEKIPADKLVEAFGMAVDALSAEAVQRWIPCSERLPAEGEKVLLVDEDGDIDIGRMIRTNNGCLFDASTWLYDIDEWEAWMPLPSAYEGKGADDEKL